MKRWLSVILYSVGAGILMSCSTQYMVQGNTSDSELEGKTLNLQSIYADKPYTIASSKVTHGMFDFTGTVDSTIIALVPLPNNSVLPVVLEMGDIQISIDNRSSVVTGSPLNDALYTFFRKNDELDEQLYRLGMQINQLEQMSQVSQMLTGRFIESDLVRDARRRANRVYLSRENYIRNFIVDNSDNVLGQYVFLASLRNADFPLSYECVEDILAHVKPQFGTDPNIARFLHDNNLIITSDPSIGKMRNTKKKRK